LRGFPAALFPVAETVYEGATQISKYSIDSVNSKKNCGSNIVYFELDPDIFKILVSSLTNMDTSTVSLSPTGLPVNIIKYPPISTILSDYVVIRGQKVPFYVNQNLSLRWAGKGHDTIHRAEKAPSRA